MQENLKREIGTFELAASVVNITVGTGIFVLPALVAENLGSAAIVCYLICGLLIFLIALCFAEVGSKVTVSGGTYAYIESAFGPYAGFLANIIFFGSCGLSDAATAYALSKTLSYFFPVIDSGVFRPIFFLFIFGGLAFVNIIGTKSGMRLIVVATFAKLIPLLLIIGFGTGRILPDNLHWKNAVTFHNVGDATLILFFAFLGIETAVNNGGEFKNTNRTVPLGILSGLAFVLILYILIQVISQGIFGEQLVMYKDAPLVAVSKLLFGPTGITLMVIATAISMFGNLSGEILANPRALFAGARDGILPQFLSKVHHKYVTPYAAIIVYAALGYLLAVFGAFKQLVILTSAATLLVYLGVVLATLKLRKKKPASSIKSFTIPGGIIVPLLAAGIIVWLLSNLSKQEIAGVAITLIILSVIFIFIKLFDKRILFTRSKEIDQLPKVNNIITDKGNV